MSPSNYGGVLNDGNGSLSGYAWGENVGWINFDPQVAGDPTNYGDTVDNDGYFDGWAWGENIGWIHFDKAKAWSVLACVVSLDDFANFASYWLQSGTGLPADLYENDVTNTDDLLEFVNYWLCNCPSDWPLK